MFDTDSYTTGSSTGLRRRRGMLGGVLSGLSRSWGIDTSVLRVATAVAAFVFGPIIVLGYLAGWLLVPADSSLPASQRPPSMPKALLYVIGAILAAQLVFGLITSLSIRWLAIGAVAAWWLMRRD